MLNRTRLLALLAALVAMVLLMAACGDADDEQEAAVDDDAPLALDDDAAEEDATEDDATEEDATEEEEVDEVEFDVVAAVDAYASTIPEGWMMIREAEELYDAMQVDGAVVVDVRNPEDYEAGHIPGAINIPIREVAENLNLIPTDSPVWIVCQTGWRTGMAVSSLHMMGYDNVQGWANEFPAWEEAGYDVETGEGAEPEDFGEPELESEMVAEVGAFLSTLPDGWLLVREMDDVLAAVDAGADLLDVRQLENFEEGHVNDATLVPIRDLASPEAEIPTGNDVIVYCQSGWRTSLSMPILHLLGYDNTLGYPGSFDAFEGADVVAS